MKKAKRKYLWRSIRKNGVSFFAVAVIAMTSIAIFFGLQSTGTAMLRSANRYFVSNKLATLEIVCANGLTQEDIEVISRCEDVDVVEGGYATTVLMDGETEQILLQALSLCDEVNEPVLIDGTLPDAPDEVAVEEIFAEEQGIQVGDEITLEHDGELVTDTFVVTGVINQPAYCCAEIEDARGTASEGTGSVLYYIELTGEAFDSDYYGGCYTKAYIRSEAMDEVFSYSDRYSEMEAELMESMEELGEERAEIRYTSLREEALDEIGKAQREIDDSQEELDEALAEIEAQLTALGLEASDLDLAKEQLAADGDAMVPLITEITQYQDGTAQIEEARTELSEAENEAGDIQKRDWNVLGRDEIGDLHGVRVTADSLYGLSYVMSIIFLLESIIVCYAAITKMISDQRTLVGVQKAMGFTPREILTHYLLYNTLCAAIGIGFGFIAGAFGLEKLMLRIFSSEILIRPLALAFDWKPALLSAGICMAIFLTAAWAACARLAKQPATELLRGEIPVRDKPFFFEKRKGYKQLSLYTRTMIKNVLSDRGRMMTTIMGVVGCIVLLVICFSLKMAVVGFSEIQFEQYFLYQNRLVMDSSTGSPDEFKDVLDAEGITCTVVQDKVKNFRVDGGDWETVHVVTAPDSEVLADYMVLEDIETKETVKIPEDGVLISRKCAELNGLSAGSTIELLDSEGNVRELQVAGVIEHYLQYHLFVMSDSYYEEIMGEEPDECVFLLKGEIDGLYEKVRDMDGFISLRDNSEYAKDGASVNMVIVICLILSAVMALMVILNQIVMYINKKSRELAVMRINGYTLKDTKAYVYKDNIVLTAIGLILGSGVGVLLSYVVIRIFEIEAQRYVRTPNLRACLYSCAVGALFVLIVNLIALRKIDQLNLTDVNGNS
ncbi:MAG: FtsX-like permease family protein [Clostridiales bacterium]|nr:FtsX-like permease family protein [Clostridiales bacterium]